AASQIGARKARRMNEGLIPGCILFHRVATSSGCRPDAPGPVLRPDSCCGPPDTSDSDRTPQPGGRPGIPAKRGDFRLVEHPPRWHDWCFFIGIVMKLTRLLMLPVFLLALAPGCVTTSGSSTTWTAPPEQPGWVRHGRVEW